MTASEQHAEYAAASTPTIGKKLRAAIEADVLRRVADQWDHRYGVSRPVDFDGRPIPAFVSIETLRAEADRIEEGVR